MPLWLAALLGFLMVARVTRFVNSDKLFEPVVDRIEAWARAGGLWRARIAYLVTCPWCASIWAAAPPAVIVAVAAPYGVAWSLWLGAGLWLGYSWLYGLVASNLDD